MGPSSFKLKTGSSIEGYIVLECLGRNYEGEVYRVFDQYSGSERAFKIFFLPSGFRYVARYAEKLQRLRGMEGVVTYCHAGYWAERDCHYTVLELVEGKDLAKLSRNRPFPVFKALKVARQLFRILACCQEERKECLGDLGLSNIVLSRDGKVTVIDLDMEARFSRKNIRADIVSVCDIFYRLNWNRGPYSRDLRRMIPKCRPTIEKRYRNASQVLEAIEELLGTK